MASELLVNKITPESGNTLTLGESGDTISFASGVLPSLESLTITGDLTVDTDTLFVDSTNNRVGIGTASPNSKTEIVDTNGGGEAELLQIRNNSTDANTTSVLRLVNSTDANSYGNGGFIKLIRNATSDNDLTFGTVNAERMRIDSSGNVGIGTTSPSTKLMIGAGVDDGIFVKDSGAAASSPTIKVQGQRSDGNGSQCFAGGIVLQRYGSGGLTGSGDTLGNIYFGGNHTDSSESNISYAASITAVADGDFNSVTDMPTAITFKTGSTGTALSTANQGYGTERMRIDSSGHVIIPNGVTLGTAAGTYNAANTIDDYEEGTWTPTLIPLGSGSITVNTSNDTLFYTKIGKMVFISGRLRVSAISSPTGNTDMGGLPFAVANLTDEAEKGQIALNTFGVNLDASAISIFLDPQASGTTLRPLQQKDDANWSGLDASGFSVGDYIAFSGFYITN